MNFTDVQGTWKQIKQYIDSKISSSGADSLPVGTLLNSQTGDNIFGSKYIKLDGSSVLKKDIPFVFNVCYDALKTYTKKVSLPNSTATVYLGFYYIIRFNNRYYCKCENYNSLYDITNIDSPSYIKDVSGNYIQNGWFVYNDNEVTYINDDKKNIITNSRVPILSFKDYFYLKDGYRTKDFVNFEKVQYKDTNTLYAASGSDRFLYQYSSSYFYIYRINDDYSITTFDIGKLCNKVVQAGNGNIIAYQIIYGNDASYIYEVDYTSGKIVNQKYFSNRIDLISVYDTDCLFYFYNGRKYYNYNSNLYVSFEENSVVGYGVPFLKDDYIYFPDNNNLRYGKYSKHWTALPNTGQFLKIK